MIAKIWHVPFLGLLFLITGCNPTGLNMQEEIVLTISHYKVPCIGENVRLCYRVKKNDGEPELFYDIIEGFDYEWGFTYTISIEKSINSDPFSDASSFTYKLKKVIKKEKALPDQTFDLPLKLGNQHLIENANGICSYLGAIEIQTGQYSCEELTKAQSAIFYHSSNTSVLVPVRLN